MLRILFLAFFAFFAASALAAKVVEPADGQLLLGAWLDVSHSSGDTPAKINARCGYNFTSFQFAQNIPVPAYNYTTGAGGPANFTFIELSGTNASVYLTVYPKDLYNVTAADWTLLGNQIKTYQSPPYNRAVFLRYAPEMNGNWFGYGMQPATFVAHWQAMHNVVSTIAPDTAFVWAPNSPIGYPWDQQLSQPYSFPLNYSTSADRAALLVGCTDGQFDQSCNGLAPYYPGDQYVDWAGLSLYWKGNDYPFVANVPTDSSIFVRAMNGYVPGDQQRYPAFYSTYCQKKPCMLSESGAAYHLNFTDGPGISQVALQNSWLDLFYGQQPVYQQFPRLKMIELFEWRKLEDEMDLRDFRLTNATDVRQAFMSRINPLIASGTILQAGPAPIVGVVPSASATALLTATPSALSSIPLATNSAFASDGVVVAAVKSAAFSSLRAASLWTVLASAGLGAAVVACL